MSLSIIQDDRGVKMLSTQRVFLFWGESYPVMVRTYSWQCMGDPMECRGSHLVYLCARQAPTHLYYHSSPKPSIFVYSHCITVTVIPLINHLLKRDRSMEKQE